MGQGTLRSEMAPLSRSLVLAGSGLALVLFLVLHLGGVSLALLDPPGFEAFSSWLHARLWLPALELGLLLALLAHPLLAVSRWLRNRTRAGAPAGGRRSRRGGGLEGLAAFSGRWLPFSGALLLLFLVVHLGQLRWSRPAAGAELQAIEAALASPLALTLYGLAGLGLALHLLHGVESAHRSLGWLDATNAARIRRLGRGLALLLGGGFALLPFALVFAAAQR
jgi:succinate dehydrogenase / fumarate reductase cytochrome b subunit